MLEFVLARHHFGYSDGTLHYYAFHQNTDRTYAKMMGLRATLVKRTDGTYEIDFDSGAKYIFGSNNRIASLQDANGNTMSFAYS